MLLRYSVLPLDALYNCQFPFIVPRHPTRQLFILSLAPARQLLGGLLEVNPGYVRDIEGMGLASQFFDFLSLEHANNNVHNIRLCRQVVAAGSMPAVALLDLQLSERVAAVVEYAAQNNVEPFLEPVLELSHTIMQKELAEMVAASADGASASSSSLTGGGLTAVFLDQAVTFLELCTRMDNSVSRVAATCVLDLVRVTSKYRVGLGPRGM